ncbi:SAV_915 family protein [Actinomadura rayongensis]|uniref:SseB protein N-terminal domain-containing protein n=1 Tax=Actinomadura rayongensis TaxID=1429076 RepID=A0A6I4WB02_9ACTN|nr:SAV_915 family protein [Actinomadura rayongensis]MXQ64244.1 hypothetical protein [Actinomadura rayongensis]
MDLSAEERVLFVPVRTSGCGAASLLLARLAGGGRVAVAFSSAERLAAVLGARQPAVRLAVPALRAMLRPLGVDRVQIDPDAVAEIPSHPGALAPVPA